MKRHMRRGASLIEMMVIVSVAGIILTLSSVLLQQVMHEQGIARRMLDAERNSLRLEQAFRQDIHGASAIEWKADQLPAGGLVRLQLAEKETIEYAVSNGQVERLHKNGTEIMSRETYAFPSYADITIDREQAHTVVLTVASAPPNKIKENAPTAPYRIPVGLRIAATLRQMATEAAR